jgi:tRNA(adenine34) deaminase
MELSHDYFMKQAIKQALLAQEADEVPIGAVVVYENQIIGRGYNQTRTLSDPTAHAEMLAITAACSAVQAPYLEECSLYVTVEPCTMCASATRWSRVKSLIYGASEPKTGYTLWNPSLLHPKTEVIRGVLVEECLGLMTAFFAAKREN